MKCKSPNRLKRHIHLIKVLSTAKNPIKRAIIDAAEKDVLMCLGECSLNILNGNVPLTENQYRNLKRHHTLLCKLCDNSTSIKDRKQILQTGGFLPALIAPILGIAGQLLIESLKKK